MFNPVSLDTVCGALCYAMGIEPPEHAAAPNELMVSYIDEKLGGKKADRIFMFNPDAVAQWVAQKYPSLLSEMNDHTELEVPLFSPFRPVTPVCFATMYSGAQPDIHGIAEYKKPVLTVDTIFDAMVRAGKKCAIIAGETCSIGTIFLNRDIDYYFADESAHANAVAARLIMEDKHDFIVCYNGNYDYWQHREGPEGLVPLAALKCNAQAFYMHQLLIREHWKNHNTLMGFAMDHGCHAINDPAKPKYKGTHYDDIPEDRNICHRYQIIPKTEE